MRALWGLAAVLLLAAGCEDALSVQAERTVHLASLPDRVLTIELPSNGTASPVGAQKVKDGEPLSLQASPSGGFGFIRWEKSSGAGAVTFGDLTVAATTVRVTGGDAAVRAVMGATVFDVTIGATGGGSVSQTLLSNLAKGVASSTVTATPLSDYRFTGWTVTLGVGVTFSPGSSAASVTITASGGDAAVQANFVRNTYAATITSQTGVWTNPTGAKVMDSGTGYPFSASVADTYIFDGWEKVSGTGTVTFSNPALTSTTVTVTAPWSSGAALSIRAKARKEALGLSESGSLAGPATTTYPDSLIGYHRNGTKLFLLGQSGTSQWVIRKYDLATPASPASGTNDFLYVSSLGTPSAMTGDGTNLYLGTSTKVARVAQSGIPGGTIVPVASSGISDLALSGDGLYLWAVRGGEVNDLTLPGLTARNGYTDSLSGWTAQWAAANTYGLYTVYEDNGANQLHGVDVVSGASSTVAPHNGADMDPGSAGKPAFNEDNEYFALPVDDPNLGWGVRIYDGTAPGGLAAVGSATVNGNSIRRLVWVGSYIYAAGTDSGGTAAVWMVDAYNLAAPAVRLTKSFPGYSAAELAFFDGSAVWVVLKDSTTGKLTLKAFTLTRS